ncbi:MAG: toprim domain-containing protein [Hadesarchaea archaeon]|nr:toprim domain-containing protein [Hadesarchaea archaeon]
MLSEKALEKTEEILEEIKKKSSKEKTSIIVEGKKDSEALRELGVKGPIHEISSNQKTALNFLESLRNYNEIIVLTDFDQEGDKLAQFSKKHLPKLGVEPEMELRTKLKKYLRKGVKDIEGLSEFIRREKIESKDNPTTNQNH